MYDGRQGGWRQTPFGLPIQRDAGNIFESEFRKRMEKIDANANPIPSQEVFLGQVVQEAGYTTAQCGILDRGFLTWAERVQRFGWNFPEGYYDHTRAHKD